ncbi:hypothetical protein NHX12_000370, partial [Muraenolepis orangiensis]
VPSGSLERCRRPVCWTDAGRRQKSCEDWEDGEEDVHMTELTSRLQTRVNLQLCFINNSESDEEEEREGSGQKKASVPVPRQTAPQGPQAPQGPAKSRSLSGFRKALRSLRDRLRTDLTPQELKALSSSLGRAIQDLNSELVGLLQSRDLLRTEQDAMLVEVQDLRSL